VQVSQASIAFRRRSWSRANLEKEDARKARLHIAAALRWSQSFRIPPCKGRVSHATPPKDHIHLVTGSKIVFSHGKMETCGGLGVKFCIAIVLATALRCAGGDLMGLPEHLRPDPSAASSKPTG